MVPSYYLLKDLMRQNPTAKVQMIIGSDLVPTLPKWVEGEKLLRECLFYVVHRPDYTLAPELLETGNFELMSGDYEPMPQSSTEIRALLEAGAEDCQLLPHLPAPVLAYIRQHSLYSS